MNPTLWIYQKGTKWTGHVDFHDGLPSRPRGRFDSEDEATVAVARMNGIHPPADVLARWEAQRRRTK